MSDDKHVNPLSEEERKRIKEYGDTLMAKVVKVNSMLRPDAIDKAEAEAVEKEDYELAAKIRDIRSQE